MKAKLFIGLAVATVAIAAATVFTVNHFSPKSQLSDLNRANLEAITQQEQGGGMATTCENRIVGQEGVRTIFCGTCNFVENSAAAWDSNTKTCQ
jgi:hypothetical protein